MGSDTTATCSGGNDIQYGNGEGGRGNNEDVGDHNNDSGEWCGGGAPVAGLSSWLWMTLCWGRPAACVHTLRSAPCPPPRRSPPSATNQRPSQVPLPGPCNIKRTHTQTLTTTFQTIGI